MPRLLFGLAPAPAFVAPSPVAAASSTTARITKVIDGDTFRTTKGTIRVIGIDTRRGGATPPGSPPRPRGSPPGGSKGALTRVKGESNTDRYGRSGSRTGVELGKAQI